MYKEILFNNIFRCGEKTARKILASSLITIRQNQSEPDFEEEFDLEMSEMPDSVRDLWRQTKIIYDINQYISDHLGTDDVMIDYDLKSYVPLHDDQEDVVFHLDPNRLKETFDNIKKLDQNASIQEISDCFITR